jgi:hypothetical protein
MAFFAGGLGDLVGRRLKFKIIWIPACAEMTKS